MSGTSAAALAFSGSMTPADDRNAGGANLLAFVAGYAMKNSGAASASGRPSRGRCADRARSVQAGPAEPGRRNRSERRGRSPGRPSSSTCSRCSRAPSRRSSCPCATAARESRDRAPCGRSMARARRLCARTGRGRPRDRGCTGRLRSGSIVMSGSTASQQASTSRPFMRTAQVPHIFEPQNQRYARSGALFSAIQLSASSTRIHFRYGTSNSCKLVPRSPSTRRTRTVSVSPRAAANCVPTACRARCPSRRASPIGSGEAPSAGPGGKIAGEKLAHHTTSRLFLVAKSGLKNGSS